MKRTTQLLATSISLMTLYLAFNSSPDASIAWAVALAGWSAHIFRTNT